MPKIISCHARDDKRIRPLSGVYAGVIQVRVLLLPDRGGRMGAGAGAGAATGSGFSTDRLCFGDFASFPFVDDMMSCQG